MSMSLDVDALRRRFSGLWLQAAELIWASLVGYFALPQPDKKVRQSGRRSESSGSFNDPVESPVGAL